MNYTTVMGVVGMPLCDVDISFRGKAFKEVWIVLPWDKYHSQRLMFP